MSCKPINFSSAEFVKSCTEESQFPRFFTQRNTPYPEIAIVGRSNAGKSSLINHLTQKKNLVYVSSTPGKTQLINFFTIDNQLLLVDLPGYGFAKVSKEKKRTWNEVLTNYLESRNELKLLILVLDMRRELSLEDTQMILWAKSLNKPLLFVFSKSDKLSSNEQKQRTQELEQEILPLLAEQAFPYVSYSIKENVCRTTLKNLISSFLHTSL
jgi:GTP-binding protein